MKRKKPITGACVERCLDTLAEIMSRSRSPHLAIPLWKRLEFERDRLLDEERIIAEAKRRAKAAASRRNAQDPRTD